MGTPNAETGKPHSATSAREAARNAPAVVAQRVALLTAERETILARARYEAARIAAWQTVHVVAGVA